MAERTSLPWWTDFRVVILIALAEMSLLALAEYKFATIYSIPGADALGEWGYILIIAGPPFIINYFLFLYGNRWKEIIQYFDGVDKEEKSKMNLQMTAVLLLVAGLFVFLLLL